MKKSDSKEKKNVTKRKKVTVQELKNNEKRYTYLFAGVFIALFIYCGYRLIAVPDSGIANKIDTVSTTVAEPVSTKSISNVSLSASVIMLDENSRLSLEKGLLVQPNLVVVENHSGEKIHYQLSIVNNQFLESKCGCGNQYDSYVWVSINGVTKKLSDYPDRVVYDDYLETGENAELSFRLWFDESLSAGDDVHFHGKFDLKY